jgi:hypothetical protein
MTIDRHFRAGAEAAISREHQAFTADPEGFVYGNRLLLVMRGRVRWPHAMQSPWGPAATQPQLMSCAALLHGFVARVAVGAGDFGAGNGFAAAFAYLIKLVT